MTIIKQTERTLALRPRRPGEGARGWISSPFRFINVWKGNQLCDTDTFGSCFLTSSNMFCQPFLVLNSSRLHLKMSKELHFDMPVKRNFVFWNKSIIRFFFLSFLNNVIDLVHFKSFTLARTHSPSNCTLAFQTFSKNPKLQDSDLRWRGGYNAKLNAVLRHLVQKQKKQQQQQWFGRIGLRALY